MQHFIAIEKRFMAVFDFRFCFEQIGHKFSQNLEIIYEILILIKQKDSERERHH